MDNKPQMRCCYYCVYFKLIHNTGFGNCIKNNTQCSSNSFCGYFRSSRWY